MELELSLGDSPAPLIAAATPTMAHITTCIDEEEGSELVLELGLCLTTVRDKANNQTTTTEPTYHEEAVGGEDDDRACTPGVSLSCPADLHPTSAQAARRFGSDVSFRPEDFDVSNTMDMAMEVPVTMRQVAVEHELASDPDEENGSGGGHGRARKKLRLSKEQSEFLEDSFKAHSTLSLEQKSKLAHRLILRPRQVEVWFQNRRARTKLKQTEVEREYLKRSCETLTQENQRLRREVAELRRALRPTSTLYYGSGYHYLPAAAILVEDYSPPPPIGTAMSSTTSSALICSAASRRRRSARQMWL